MATDAKRKANAKYDKENTIQKKLKLNKTTDADIIAWLEKKDNVNGYLKELIREDKKMTKKMVEVTREMLNGMEFDREIELTEVVWVGDVLENCVGEVRPVTVKGVETYLDYDEEVAKCVFEVELEEVKCSAEPTLEEIENSLNGEWMEFADYESVKLLGKLAREEQEKVLAKEIEKLNRYGNWEIEKKYYDYGTLTARMVRTVFDAKCAAPNGFAGTEHFENKEITVYDDLTVEVM